MGSTRSGYGWGRSVAVDFLVFPDLEAVAGYVLRQANIAGLGTRVYSSIPKTPTYPLIRYQRTGGFVAVQQALDGPRIQFEVWGGAPGDGAGAPTKSDIHDIAQLARVELLRMAGQSYTEPVDAYITAVTDAMGLSWSPDPPTSRDRYIFSMNVYGKPLEE